LLFYSFFLFLSFFCSFISFFLPFFCFSVFLSFVFLSFFLLCCFVCFVLFCLRQGFSPLPRLKYSGTILAQGKLHLQGSSDPFTSASEVPGTTGTHHHTQLIFCMGFHHVVQAGLKLLGSRDSPASAYQSAGITAHKPSEQNACWRKSGQGLCVTPRLECSCMITSGSLNLLGSSNPPTSGSQVAGSIDRGALI
uniref:Uncharacterized protein n=2 Tax=Callithrix jacchus TaxID=9483 RepID=A0A8I3WL64_CALJA